MRSDCLERGLLENYGTPLTGVWGLSASLNASLFDDSQRGEGAVVVDNPFLPFLDLTGRQLSDIINDIIILLY